MWNTPPLSSINNDGYMSSSHYNKLDNLYTKTEIDTLIENSSSGGFDINIDINDYNNIWDYQKAVTNAANKLSNGDIGDHVTTEQSANISNGTFKGLPIGAYWTIDGIRYRIMDRDIFYGYNSISTHHVVVMPDTCYSLQKYNNTDANNTTGGYVASDLKKYIDNTYNPYISNIFGDNHILSHTHDLLACDGNNLTRPPVPTIVKAWIINRYEVLNQNSDWVTYLQNEDKITFSAFTLVSNLKKTSYNWWLSPIHSGGYYSDYSNIINTSGEFEYKTSNYTFGVRPAFLVY